MVELPTRMAAVRFGSLGGPEVLEVAEVPVPRPGPGQVLVRVRAAGLNPVDAAARAVPLSFLRQDRFPRYAGWDVAGDVVDLGEGVDRLRVGDEVFGLAGFPGPAATHAGYAVVTAADLARRPRQLDWPAAGALPLVGLTVLQAYAAAGGVRPGQRVLVEAAAGGVGHIAAQVAKAAGGYVLGTASAANQEFLRSIGVDEPIDHAAADDVYAIATDLDLVLNSLGPETAARAVPAIVPGGFLVSIRSGATAEVGAAADARGVGHANILVRADGTGMTQLADLVYAGQLRVHVDAVYPLDRIDEAHRQIEARHTVGKIVLVPPA